MPKTVKVCKPSIELAAYETFCKRFERGEFKGQRFGQAFYNEFDLHKIDDQGSLHNLYAKDGDHARNSIKHLFQFT